MKLQTSATGLLEKTSRLLRAGHGQRYQAIFEPSWYKVVAQHPPTHALAAKTHNLKEFVEKPHTLPIGARRKKQGGTYVTRNKQEYSARMKHLYRPRQIHFFEDKIRKLFYEQHPWELARPRLVVENDGNDSSRQDWSKGMNQVGKKLDGESVVQRALYLVKHEFSENDWLKAYDKARLEFYRLRMREEAEIQVAAEEAQMYGAVFGKSYIDYGVEQEQKVIEQWVQDAVAATQVRQSKMTGGGSSFMEESNSSSSSTTTKDNTSNE